MAYTKNNIKFNTFDGNISGLLKKIGNMQYAGATVDDLDDIEEANNGQLPTTFNALEIDWNGADLSSALGSSYSSIKTTAQLLNAIKEASTRGGTTLPNNMGKSAGAVLSSSNNSQGAIGQTIDNTVPSWSTAEPAILTGMTCNEYGCIDKIYAASKNEFIKWLDIQSGEIVSSYEIEFDMSAFVDLFNTRDLGITASTLRTRTTKGNVIFWFVGQSRVSLSCDITYQYNTSANDGSFTITVSTPNIKVINNIERTFTWAKPFIKTGFTIIDNNNAFTTEFDNVKYNLTRTSATTFTEYGTTYLQTTFSGRWDSAAWPSVTPSIEPSDGSTYTIETEQAFQEFYITNSTPINLSNIFEINLNQLMSHKTFDLDPTYRKQISVNITIESTEDGKTYTGKCNLPATIRYNEELDAIDLEVLTNYIYQQQVFPGQNVTILGANIYNMTLPGAWTMDQLYDDNNSITLEQLIQHNSSLLDAIQWKPNATYSDYQANVINNELFGPQAQRSIKKDITIVDNYEMKKYPFVNISFDVESSIKDSVLKIKFDGKTYNLSAVRTYEDDGTYYMSDRINTDNIKDLNRVHRLVFQYNLTTQKETDKIRLDGIGSRMNILDMMGADFCDAFDPYKIDSDNENNYNDMINDRHDYISTYSQYISSNREYVPIDIELYFDPGTSNVSSIENTEFKLIFTINNALYDNKYNYEFENSQYVISEYKNSRIIFLNDNKSKYSVTEYYVSHVHIMDTVLILSIKTNNSSYSYSGQQPIYIENLVHYCEPSYPCKIFLDNIKNTISKTYVENSFESSTSRTLGPAYLNTLVTCNHPGYKIDENINCQVQVELAKSYIDVSKFNIPDDENYIKVSITLPLKVETTINHRKLSADNVDYPMKLQTYYWNTNISQSNIKKILSYITKNDSTNYFECFGYTTTISDTLYEMNVETVTIGNETINYKPYQYTYYVEGSAPQTETRNDVLVLYLKYVQKEPISTPTPIVTPTPTPTPSSDVYLVKTETSTNILCSTIEWAICESYVYNQNNLRTTNIDVTTGGGETILYDGLYGPSYVGGETYPELEPTDHDPGIYRIPQPMGTAPASSLNDKANFNQYMDAGGHTILADAYVLKYATLYVQQAIRYKFTETKSYSDNSTKEKDTYETIRRLPAYSSEENQAYTKSTYSGAGFSARILETPIFWNRGRYCKIWKLVKHGDENYYDYVATNDYYLSIESSDISGYMYKIRLRDNDAAQETAKNEDAVFVEAWVAIPDSSASVVAIPITLLFAPNIPSINPSSTAT